MVDSSFFIIIRDIIPWVAIYFIINLSLNLEFGYLGLPNFGKLLAVAGGAFVIGSVPGLILAYLLDIYAKGLDYYEDNNYVVYTIFNEFLKSNPMLSISLLVLSLILAILAGAGLGFISSYPALRLKEDYLGMTLLAFAEIIVAIGINYKYPVNGTIGVTVPDFFAWINDANLRQLVVVGITSFIALVIFLIVNRFVNSPLGRVLRAIRDNEILAQTYGKDLVKYRRNVLIFAGALAGLAGGLFAIYVSSVLAVGYTRLNFTFIPWVMVVVGGLANNIGIFVGTTVFMVALRLTDIYKSYIASYLPFDVTWFTPLLLSIILTFMLIFRPSGLIPERPTRTLSEKEIVRILNSLKNKQ